MIERGSEYVERFGFSRRSVLIILASVIFVALALVVPEPAASRIVMVVFFGGGGLLSVLTAASRKVALRVDASGVTLGGSPFRYAATTEHVPWSDVNAIVLWHQQVRTARLPYFGIERRPEAFVPWSSGLGESISRRLVPHVPADVARFSRPMTGWRVNRQQLAAAVERFSPGTPIDSL
jgi:hypothetical protein